MLLCQMFTLCLGIQAQELDIWIVQIPALLLIGFVLGKFWAFLILLPYL